MKTALSIIASILVAAAIAAAIYGLVYLDYVAYRQRFPQADPWTYFFQGGRR